MSTDRTSYGNRPILVMQEALSSHKRRRGDKPKYIKQRFSTSHFPLEADRHGELVGTSHIWPVDSQHGSLVKNQLLLDIYISLHTDWSHSHVAMFIPDYSWNQNSYWGALIFAIEDMKEGTHTAFIWALISPWSMQGYSKLHTNHSTVHRKTPAVFCWLLPSMNP